jgi:hypothetical protein
VKILFFVDTLGGTRHFTEVVFDLVDRGHTVILATARQDGRAKRGAYDHPRIDIVSCPTQRTDRWAPVIDPLRRTGDGVRFLDPRYAQAPWFVQRAAAQMPKTWSRALDRRPWLKRRWTLIQGAMMFADTLTPCDPKFQQFIESHAPDVILVTPLIDFGSYQTDYVKCANRLGIPVLFLLYGWDNLTSRGLIRVAPDRALVWNSQQRREAVEYQRLPAERVIATGAPRFDAFFEMRPSSSRDEFCAGLSFDPGRPLLLYMCSARPIAPNEGDFVWRWVNELRRAAGASWLRDCQVLVRPHPAHRHEWDQADPPDPGVRVWSGRLKMNADQGLFDSLFHSAAVVGLNTSAMIEAAIVGRPVYTIALPEFAGCQSGMVHFGHVLARNGGIVSLSESFAEHFRQLTEALDYTAETLERSRQFLASFVRPNGLDVPASRTMVEEIERSGSIRKRPLHPPFWHYPLRWTLQAAFRASLNRGEPQRHSRETTPPSGSP